MKPIKVSLVDYSLFLRVSKEAALTFRYNPGELDVREDDKYAEVTIPGREETLFQFISGEAYTIPLNLVFTDHREPHRAGIKSVEDSIAFLEEAKRPKTQTGLGDVPFPSIMAFIYGNIKIKANRSARIVGGGMQCIITEMSVKRDLFAKGNVAARAWVNIKLREYVGPIPVITQAPTDLLFSPLHIFGQSIAG